MDTLWTVFRMLFLAFFVGGYAVLALVLLWLALQDYLSQLLRDLARFSNPDLGVSLI